MWQPWKAIELIKDANGYICLAKNKVTGEKCRFHTKIIIAAHGSWETGTLLAQLSHRPPKSSDLFGFKAHFQDGHLPLELMPLLVFPGGYGGMVQTDGNRISLSCCIRRDKLLEIRRVLPKCSAAEAVLQHLRTSCLGVDNALEGARSDGKWLSVGPIRPGIRSSPATGIFLVGNAAGEAHPIIAEGISIAMQSAWLLCQLLTPSHNMLEDNKLLAQIAKQYQASWRRNFLRRMLASFIFARLAMSPLAIFLSFQS